MRSELVFQASRHVQNRFALCHWVRVASRKFHRTGDSIQETISKVLSLAPHQSAIDQAGEMHIVASLAGEPLRPAPRSSTGNARLLNQPIRNVG